MQSKDKTVRGRTGQVQVLDNHTNGSQQLRCCGRHGGKGEGFRLMPFNPGFGKVRRRRYASEGGVDILDKKEIVAAPPNSSRWTSIPQSSQKQKRGRRTKCSLSPTASSSSTATSDNRHQRAESLNDLRKPRRKSSKELSECRTLQDVYRGTSLQDFLADQSDKEGYIFASSRELSDLFCNESHIQESKDPFL
mgnify:CR=1 FL=1